MAVLFPKTKSPPAPFLHVVLEAALAQPAVIVAPANGALPEALAEFAQRKQIKQKVKPIPLQALQNLQDLFLHNARRKPKKEQDVAEAQKLMAIVGNTGASSFYFNRICGEF